MADENLNVSKLVLIPALITLGVTVLRLVGELNHWNPSLFNRAAGGGRGPDRHFLARAGLRRVLRGAPPE